MNETARDKKKMMTKETEKKQKEEEEEEVKNKQKNNKTAKTNKKPTAQYRACSGLTARAHSLQISPALEPTRTPGNERHYRPLKFTTPEVTSGQRGQCEVGLNRIRCRSRPLQWIKTRWQLPSIA